MGRGDSPSAVAGPAPCPPHRAGVVRAATTARHGAPRQRLPDPPPINPLIHRQTLADLLRRSAARFPHKTAIICGETRWTAAEFDALCSRLAAGLAGRGIANGDRVAMLARLGAVLMPIKFMLKVEEAAYILRHAGARLLVTDSGLADLARDAAALDTAVEGFVWMPSAELGEPVPGMTPFDALCAVHAVAQTPRPA